MACALCAAELENLEDDARDQHICTHQPGLHEGTRQDDEASETGSTGIRNKPTGKHRQPDAGVIRQDLATLDDRFDTFTNALSVLTGFLEDAEGRLYEDHLVTWAEYVGCLKDKAYKVIRVLEAPIDKRPITQTMDLSQGSDAMNDMNAAGTSNQSAPEDQPSGSRPVGAGADLSASGRALNALASSFQPSNQQPDIAVVGTVIQPEPSQQDQSGVSNNTQKITSPVVTVQAPQTGSEANTLNDTNLKLAILAMNSISESIDDDIQSIEQEVSVGIAGRGDGYISDLKQFAADIETRVRVEYREAAEQCSRLDISDMNGTCDAMMRNTRNFQSRIRAIQAAIRHSRSSTAPSSLRDNNSPITADFPPIDRSYKPFMKRLEPPTFSGRIEDWPEFRSVWKDLLAEFPESVQVQHLKTNIPEADARRVAGVKTMDEMWRRLERVYGDTDLNIITVKTTLENFSPKSTQDHKRIMEVYEAIETASTQLQNLNALQYLKDDFGLISKLVLKLPAADQRQYSQYLTTTVVRSDPRSRWEKFWAWIQQLHESAVQSSLIHMCDRTSGAKPSNVAKSGITCNNCNGVGHFARSCPSKSKSGVTGNQVKVNLAVVKINTRAEYNQYLPESKKQIGKCPCCNQDAHTYLRKFPFGQAEWPTNRLETCPQFLAKTARERGELMERIKGCYRCTSWKHLGNNCLLKGKTTCSVVTAGSACSGQHHKLLHGSGVAFCHKVSVIINKVNTTASHSGPGAEDLSVLPDLNQPVLLEIQAVSVSGLRAKVMFDNGSSAALVTHRFAEQAGLKGEMVSYWLAVVGHDKVLRSTMLYTLHLQDNHGTWHTIQAYGIDAISEDSAILDLSGVRTIFPGAPLEVFNRPEGPIDLLVGSMYRNVQPYGGEDAFTQGRLRLVKSLFGCGFILTGTHPSILHKENSITDFAKTLGCCTMVADDDIPAVPSVSCNRAVMNLRIPEFFEAEELGVSPAKSCKRCRGCRECSFRNVMISREKEQVVQRVEDSIKHDVHSCKVSASYPWTEDVVKLRDNIGQVISFQSSVERKLLRDKSLLNAYNSELQKFIDRGAIVRLSQEEIDSYSGPVSYVSHHAVFKPGSASTPLRIVTNTSLKNQTAGLSPNDCMMEGPNALSSLLEVIIGFRMYEVALVYDMTKAYQSIGTGQVEKHVRRIVWRWGETSEPWEILAYNVVTFGDQIAGLILELVKSLAANLGRSLDEEASHQILHKTYVDDGAGGGTRDQVERFRGNRVNGCYDGTIAQILGLVGLKLKVMVASGDEDSEAISLMGEKVLGHNWKPTEDKFVFKMKTNLATSKRGGQKSDKELTVDDIGKLPSMILTKRMLLGLVMSQYDPMGLICPVTIILKIHLRGLFSPGSNLDWDEALPRHLHETWTGIISMLLHMGDIVISRAVKPEGTIGQPTLIGFADGSLEAYACSVYIRWELEASDGEDQEHFVRLVCGKARVTPVKGTTVPRSELSGLLILSRLLKVVCNAMDTKPSEIYIAVDSECTISAMEKSGGVLAPYFASRVSEVASNLSDLAEESVVHPIQHVPGALNPADLPTRAYSSPEDVMEHSVWQSGPSFLAHSKQEWPFSRDFLHYIPEQELRVPKAAFNLTDPQVWNSLLGKDLDRIITQIMERSNCLMKTSNVTARILKCLFSLDRTRIEEPLTAKDILVARTAQFMVSMGPTLVALENGKLDSLRPYSKGGIVYMRGRIEGSLLALFGVTGLPILMRGSRLAKLIMWECHEENHRASSSDVLARSRQRAWIVKGRFLAKEVCLTCPRCKLLRMKMVQQLMSDVPDHQLHPCPPFTNISLDFAGPYRAKAMGNSRATIKLWGLVIVCQNTRAIKMLATSGYSTDDFLTAYHRFTANFGTPLLVVSDSGSQLKRAGQIIEQGDPAGLDWAKIQEGAAKSGTTWKVVEPGCQWRNGLAEAAVKLLKSTLDLTLASQSALNYAELDTLFSSVANLVNQRPIGVRSYTDEDLHAITPNDLLLQRSRNTVPGLQYDANESITRRQQFMMEVEQLWWEQWSIQVIPHLVPFRRWKLEHRPIQVGDIVAVVYEKRIGKGTYRLGRVLRVHPDGHGRVRTITVGVRGKDRPNSAMPYVPKTLEEHTLGVQRVAVICPVEDQVSGDGQ